MAMITRCPECLTMFQVVADQLRVSQGWVRCGKCSAVFNGSQYLEQDGSQDEQDGDEAQWPSTTITAEPQNTQPQFSQKVRSSGFADLDLPTPARNEAPVQTSPDRDQVHETTLRDQAFEVPEPSEKTPYESSAKPLSFVRAPAKTRWWSSRWGRRVLILCSLFLTLTLMLQAVWHERDWLATLVPASRPVLIAACDYLDCRIEPLKMIEAVTIESSSFNRIRADNYRLQVGLKNAAHTELAMPALELTLTDTRDVAILRRVLLPEDFAAANRTLAPDSDWNTTLALAVPAAALGTPVAGYRVLAFYP